MSETASSDTKTWPELAIGLYDRLTARNAEIKYDFDELEIDVPSSVNPEAKRAHWRLNGAIRVTTRNGATD